MPAEEQNVAALRRAYAAWSQTGEAGFRQWLDLMADDVVFRSLAGGAPGVEFTRDCTSKADVIRYFQGLAQDWAMVHFTPESFVAQGDTVVMRGQCCFRHRGTGKIAETPKADFVRFHDGKVVEVFEFYDTAAMMAATR